MKKSPVVRTASIALPLILAACSSNGGLGAPDAGNDGAPQSLLDPPPAGQGFQVGMSTSVPAATETFRCMYAVVPAGPTSDFQRFQTRYTANSHHMIVYTTSLTPQTIPKAGIFDCNTVGDLHFTGSMFGSQSAARDLTYPDGVAFHLTGQVVLLQAHYINTTDAATDAQVLVNAWYATTPPTQRASGFGFYDYTVVIPPTPDAAHPGTATLHMRVTIPKDMSILSWQSHAHRRLTHFHSELSGGGAATPVTLYDTNQWDAPDPILNEPPTLVKAGQVIDYFCTYKNDRPSVTVQGPSALDNEMCMLVGNYYPAIDPIFEIGIGVGSGPVYAGTKTCAQSLSCLAGAPDQLAQQQCMIQTCPGPANDKLNDFVACSFLHCAPGDQACVLSKCSPQLSACQSAVCM